MTLGKRGAFAALVEDSKRYERHHASEELRDQRSPGNFKREYGWVAMAGLHAPLNWQIETRTCDMPDPPANFSNPIGVAGSAIDCGIPVDVILRTGSSPASSNFACGRGPDVETHSRNSERADARRFDSASTSIRNFE